MERAIEHLGADALNELAIVVPSYREAVFHSRRFMLVAGSFLDVEEMRLLRNRVKAIAKHDLANFMVGRNLERCLLACQISGNFFVAVSGNEWAEEQKGARGTAARKTEKR